MPLLLNQQDSSTVIMLHENPIPILSSMWLRIICCPVKALVFALIVPPPNWSKFDKKGFQTEVHLLVKRLEKFTGWISSTKLDLTYKRNQLSEKQTIVRHTSYWRINMTGHPYAKQTTSRLIPKKSGRWVASKDSCATSYKQLENHRERWPPLYCDQEMHNYPVTIFDLNIQRSNDGKIPSCWRIRGRIPRKILETSVRKIWKF